MHGSPEAGAFDAAWRDVDGTAWVKSGRSLPVRQGKTLQEKTARGSGQGVVGTTPTHTTVQTYSELVGGLGKIKNIAKSSTTLHLQVFPKTLKSKHIRSIPFLPTIL